MRLDARMLSALEIGKYGGLQLVSLLQLIYAFSALGSAQISKLCNGNLGGCHENMGYYS